MRIISVLLFMLMILTGCSGSTAFPTDENFHFETDAQSYSFGQGESRSIAESETGYYFSMLLGGFYYLFYADKDTMEPVPVCSKPNCMHYEETDQEKRELCNAHVTGIPGSGIFYYNGKLYLPEYSLTGNETEINEYSLDGTVRKTLFSLKEKSYFSSDMLFHRGYFYVASNTYDEETNALLQVWRYSLDRPAQKGELLFEQSAPGASIQDVRAYGNRLFFTVFLDGSSCYYQMDLQTLETKEICKAEDEDSVPHIYLPFEDFMFLKMVYLEPQKEIYELKETIYIADQNGEILEKWMDTDYNILAADDKYIYDATFGRYIQWGWVEEPYIRVYNKEGEMLAQCNPLDYGIDDFLSFHVMPGKHVFLYDTRKVYYFSKADIETGEIHPKLLIDCS